MGTLFSKKKSEEEIILEKYINDLLKNKNINNSLIPDTIERNLYINILKLLINHIKEITDTIRIEFIGHVFTIKMEKLNEEKTSKT